MIEKILPPEVASVEDFGDAPAGSAFAEVAFPEEEAAVVRAVAKRRHEFLTVRACARRALAELGFPPVPILPGERGAPQWPAGVAGSMTHCDGYRAAAVSTTVRALGIDAEPHEPLPDGVLDAIALPPELARTDLLARAEPAVHWDRLLFSAKESVYKAWFPQTGRWLGFEDAELTFARDGHFTARILTPGSTREGTVLTGFTGRWLVADGLLVTAIATA